MMKKIFSLEDDNAIAKNLMLLLNTEGFIITHASTRGEALTMLAGNKFDLALIDISLPDGNGFTVCTQIKEMYDMPVIFLTASGDEASVVTGLNMGADDYITKPFRPRELVARIQAALRKRGGVSPVFETGGLLVDTASGVVKKHGSEVFLSALEYRLLLVQHCVNSSELSTRYLRQEHAHEASRRVHYAVASWTHTCRRYQALFHRYLRNVVLVFISNPNCIITRGRLLDELWDAAGEFVNDNTLTVYIKRLRDKIEDNPASPQIILTVRGTGYRLGEAYASQ